jgi:hypothetical protein
MRQRGYIEQHVFALRAQSLFQHMPTVGYFGKLLTFASAMPFAFCIDSKCCN